MAVFVLSVAWGAASGFGYHLLHRHTLGEANPALNAAVLGAVTGIFTLFILSFLGGVLLSVLDATFVCWAIDKDSQTVSNVLVGGRRAGGRAAGLLAGRQAWTIRFLMAGACLPGCMQQCVMIHEACLMGEWC